MNKRTQAILLILTGIALAIVGTTPPGLRSLDISDAEFSAERAMAHVDVIAAQPHPTGSEANAEVRAYLSAQLEELGAGVLLTEGAVPERSLVRFGKWSGTQPEALTLINVIGVIPGRDRTKPAIALMAHHDTVWGSPGAPDDTAGVASILEVARAITSQGMTERDIIILLTDGEELGLLGAKQFFSTNALADRIGAVINLEARGGGGRTTLFQTSAGNGPAVKLYADVVSRPAGSSLSAFVYETLPNDTDLTPALERDYVSYNFGFIGRPGLYHSPKATPAALDRGSVQDMGAQALALTAALANSDTLPQKTENITFFDVFGLFMMSYGVVVGWILLGLTALLNIYCLRSDTGENGWLKSLGASATVLIGGGLVLYLLNWLSGAGAGEANYYDRLAAIPLLEAQALLVCVAVMALAAPLWAGRRGSIVGVLFALAAQIYAPTTAYLIVWPMLLGGLAGAISIKWDTIWAKIGVCILGALVLGFLLQNGHQFMQGVGPDMPSIVALLAALLLPTLGLMVPLVDRKKAWTVAGACLVLAAAFALWVRFDPVADTVAAYESMK